MNGYLFSMMLLGLVIGFGAAFLVKGVLERNKANAASREADRIIGESKARADALLKEAS